MCSLIIVLASASILETTPNPCESEFLGILLGLPLPSELWWHADAATGVGIVLSMCVCLEKWSMVEPGVQNLLSGSSWSMFVPYLSLFRPWDTPRCVLFIPSLTVFLMMSREQVGISTSLAWLHILLTWLNIWDDEWNQWPELLWILLQL